MPDHIPPCPGETGVSLRTRAYYKIGGAAHFLAQPETLADLSNLLHWNRTNHYPLALIGKGSNSLISDLDFPGIMISLEKMRQLRWLSDDHLLCEAGAENTRIAETLLAAGKSGGEWLYQLPGQIGGSARMNARCFGQEMADITTALLTLTLDGRLQWQAPGDIFQGYKQTSLMEKPDIVVAVLLHFPNNRPAHEIRQQMQKHQDDRTTKHHFDYPSCGSTFKNNYATGRSSGMIFESLGFKGAAEGDAVVSEHHANFIYNKGTATAEQVLTLAARMRAAALEQAGATLDLEVQCIGLFTSKLLDSCGVTYRTDSQDPAKGWTGLLWYPEQKAPAAATPEFPRQLIQGPLISTAVNSKALSFPPIVTVEQLSTCDEAAANPERAFLRWTTTTNPALFTKSPPPQTPAFTDNLWHYSVTELFIASTTGNRYLEVEMTPAGHWLALHFDAARQRAQQDKTPAAASWSNHLRLFLEQERFGMELCWPLIEPYITTEQTLAFQCCLSTGDGTYALFPWWQPSTEHPDFHQPERFFKVFLL